MSWTREIWSYVLRVHRAGMLTVGRVVNRHRRNMYFAASCWPPSAVLSIWRCTFPIRCSAVAQTSVRRLRHCPSHSNAHKLWFKSCRYPRLRHELDGWDRFGWDRISVAKNAGHAEGFIRYLWFISRCINRSVLDNIPCWGIYRNLSLFTDGVDTTCGDNVIRLSTAHLHESGRVSVRTFGCMVLLMETVVW